MKWILSLALFFAFSTIHAQDLASRHELIQEKLDELTISLNGFPEKAKEITPTQAALIFTFFDEVLLSHFTWEEETFYPACDECIRCSRAPFTASLRREHLIMRRWIQDLKTLTNSKNGSITEFTQIYYKLLGLLKGHMETEDVILIPVANQCSQ